MARHDDENKRGKPDASAKDAAQQIWLAGLGAFAKAQQEGTKVFEALVKEGVGLQKKTQAAAEDGLSQAQSRFAHLASELGTRATGSWGKLENIFEERVARALEKLGMPSAADVAALEARIEALEARLREQAAPRKPALRKAPAGRKTPAAGAKKSARRRPDGEG